MCCIMKNMPPLNRPGTFTLWVGTGPSSFHSEIPLWMIPEGQPHTIMLSGITAERVGPMHVGFQIAGEDAERVLIQEIRIKEIETNVR